MFNQLQFIVSVNTRKNDIMMYELMQLLMTAVAAAEIMEVKYSWVYVDYTFGSPEERQSAINSKSFIPENCVVLDVDVFQCKQCYII